MIGLTSGCFDVMHLGHLQFLRAASDFIHNRNGNFYILLNTDESVKRLKGKNRPINNYDIRYEQLQILPWVDDVFSLEYDTPKVIIEKFKPKYFLKTDNYTIQDIEKDIGKMCEVVLLPFGADISTTKMIHKIYENTINR